MSDVKVNRAPFLTLWASVVARHLGYDEDEALTLGRAVASLTAYSKGRRLGIYEQRSETARRKTDAGRAEMSAKVVLFMDREIHYIETNDGLRALSGTDPIKPEAVRRYLEAKLGDDLVSVEDALTALAETYDPEDLEAQAMDVYMRLRPNVPKGKKGWGKEGLLDTAEIERLTTERRSK